MRRSGRRKKRVNYSEDALFEENLRKGGRTMGDWYAATETRAPPPVRKVGKRIKAPAVRYRADLRERSPTGTTRIKKPKKRKAPVPDNVAEWEDMGARGWAEALVGLVSARTRHRQVVEGEGDAAPADDDNTPGARFEVSKRRRHLLFMNVGVKAIRAAQEYLSGREPVRPGWMQFFPRGVLTLQGSRVHFEGLPLALPDEKRHAVKKLYFDPREASTIRPITDRLRLTWANISKKNVTQILRTLETYQLNFGRRLPKKIMNRTLFTKPGVIAIDTFYPSREWGWDVTHGYAVLCCIDCWSRFSRAYACADKTAHTVGKALERYLVEFASLGHLPRRVIKDQGTELVRATPLMERYRLERDGDGPMIINSFTGAPVLVVEGMNALYQRRMQVFRTSNLTDSPATILEHISEQLNNQKIPAKGNLSPFELLRLNDAGRKILNKNYKDKALMPPEGNMTPLVVGNTVRVLLMTRKEQVKPKEHQKGFAPKWSRETYTVLKRTGLRRNPGVFKYHLGTYQSYYRFELLKIPKQTDVEVYDMDYDKTERIEGDYDPDSDYQPEEGEDSD